MLLPDILHVAQPFVAQADALAAQAARTTAAAIWAARR